MGPMSQPTPDEIERVRAWEREQSATKAAADQQRRVEIEQANREALRRRLVGRTITAVECKADSYSNPSNLQTVWDLRLIFDDGTAAEFSQEYDGAGIEISTGRAES